MFTRIARSLNYRYNRFLGKILGETSRLEREYSKGRLDPNTFYDLLTHKILEKVLRLDSFCIDIGCFRGEILAEMMHMAPQGEFLAFEPLPDFYSALVKRFPSKHVHLYNIALSQKRGETPFNYVMTNPAYSGLKKRRYDRDEEDSQIIVKTDLLDNILNCYPGKHVDFVKIDVEGAELLVLQGAKTMIQRDRPHIVFEHGMGGADFYQTTPEQVYTLLCEECDLYISLLPAFLHCQKPLRKEQFCKQYYNRQHFYFIAHPNYGA